jgi:hypothetical protein
MQDLEAALTRTRAANWRAKQGLGAIAAAMRLCETVVADGVAVLHDRRGRDCALALRPILDALTLILESQRDILSRTRSARNELALVIAGSMSDLATTARGIELLSQGLGADQSLAQTEHDLGCVAQEMADSVRQLFEVLKPVTEQQAAEVQVRALLARLSASSPPAH